MTTTPEPTFVRGTYKGQGRRFPNYSEAEAYADMYKGDTGTSAHVLVIEDFDTRPSRKPDERFIVFIMTDMPDLDPDLFEIQYEA